MAIHRIKVTTVGYFDIDDESMEEAYDTNSIETALHNQMSWLNDYGDYTQFILESVNVTRFQMEYNGHVVKAMIDDHE